MTSLVKRTRLISLLFLLYLFGVALPARATTLVVPTDDDLVIGSRAIVRGKVISITTAADGDSDRIYSYITVKVQEVLKGNLTDRLIVIKELGGEVGDRFMTVYGNPRFKPGEKVFLYLDTWRDGSLRTYQMFLGKYEITIDSLTGEEIARRSTPEGDSLVIQAHHAQPGSVSTTTERMRLSDFTDMVRGKLSANWGLSEQFALEYYQGLPLLDHPPEYKGRAGKGELRPQYTFITSPPARWFEPDEGQPVTVTVKPDNSPIPSVLSAMEGSMAAWSNVAGSALRLSSGGLMSECVEGNIGIVFDNCDGRNAPSPRCSGILAWGGLNGLSRATKTVNGTTFRQITLGFVSFNPFASCHFTDTCKVQEIGSHEIGHAVGFGHSSDNDATMAPTIHGDGRCASIRADEVAGASFTYPATGGGGEAPAITTPPALPAGTINTTYSQRLEAIGGRPPYTWTRISGQLPPGLSLSAHGNITGTPTESGSFTFNARVQDAAARSDTSAFSISVSPSGGGGRVTITTTALEDATTGTFYSQFLSAEGGRTPYRWVLVSGTTPTGITLTSAGAISGTPSTAGSFTFTVKVTDAESRSAQKQLSLVVNQGSGGPEITTSSLPSGQVGVAYSARLSATGGAAPYRFTVSHRQLPIGLTLSESGQLTGTPSLASGFDFAIRVTDARSASSLKEFSVLITDSGGDGNLQVTTSTLPNANLNTAYSQQLEATGGTSPYAWTIASGSLPAGLTLSSTGFIRGTPSAAGASSFTVKVTDFLNRAATKALTLVVSGGGGLTPWASRFVSQEVPAQLQPGAQFEVRMTWTNTGTETWSEAARVRIASQNPAGTTRWGGDRIIMPTSMRIAPGQQLSLRFTLRAPTAAGTYNFQWQLIRDGNGYFGEPSPNIAIAVGTPRGGGGGTITIAGSASHQARRDSFFTSAYTAAGGAAPYRWSLSAGTLPPGLALNATTGVISGTPAVNGTSAFTIKVTDNANLTATKQVTITIAGSVKHAPKIKKVKVMGGGKKVIIIGQDFAPRAIVMINGAQIPATSISPTQIVTKKVTLVNGRNEVRIVNPPDASSDPFIVTVGRTK